MNVIIERVRWASRMFDVREVTFDRWGGIKAAATLMLVPEGFICVDIPQTIGGLTAATKQFIGLYMNSQARSWEQSDPELARLVSCTGDRRRG